MLAMVFLLGGISAWVELRLIKLVPGLKSLERYKLWSICFSISLSYILGLMFGVTGLIAFTAGLFSTAITEVYRYWLQFKRENVDVVLAGIQKINTTKKWTKEFGDTYKYIILILKWAFIVVTCPIWIPVLLNHNRKNGLTLKNSYDSWRKKRIAT